MPDRIYEDGFMDAEPIRHGYSATALAPKGVRSYTAILPPISASNQASGDPSTCVYSPEVLGDFGLVGELRPRLIEMVNGLQARGISRRHLERSPYPHEPSRRELNLFTLAKANRDHLIWNPVCWVQDISSLREQNKIANPVAYVGGLVALHHVSERLDRFGGQTALSQSEPVEQHVLTWSLPDGSEIREIRLGSGDDRQ